MNEGYKEAEKRIVQVRFGGLTELNLWGQSLDKVPESIEELSDLKSLDLRYNQIRDISFLEKLSSLQYLYLSHNQIADYSFLEKLTGLQKLNLSGNQITDISFLSTLISLQKLNLSGNQITDISFLSTLTGLKTLNLSGNQITDMSFLEKLTCLQTLDFGGNEVRDISFLEKLISLQTLDLSGNQISNYNFLSTLTDLQELDLGYNQITDMSFLEKLTSLQTLELRNNKITDISFLERLTRLQTLDLRNNQISDIKPLLPLIRHGLDVSLKYSGRGIIVEDNPISSPSESIIKEGRESVLSWFDQLADQGEAPLYEAKLMILGQGGAGKTTFSELQINPNYKVEKGKLDATLGIKIHKGKLFPHSVKAGAEIKAHLWDFGGQNIQKMLHQFFITENCLYVLVSDKRKENANFDYWFQIINLLGPKSPVVVLENEMDAKGNNESFAINTYRDLFPDLNIEVREVNLGLIRKGQKRHWEQLNITLSDKLSHLEIVNREVPKKWTLVRDALTELKNKKYITTRMFFELCEQPEIGLNEDQAQLCLLYLNSLGDLVYFNEGELKTYIFLDHEWLTKGLYYILADERIEEQQGRFTLDQAYQKWGKRYRKPEKDMLLLLLLKDRFDLCYELPEEKGVFITPLLLDNDQLEKWPHETNLHFQYNYGFMPHGIFSRAIVRLHEKIEDNDLWRKGVRLYDEAGGARAEVRQFTDKDDNLPVIDIKVSGDKKSCKDLLAFIRKNIDPLHREFNNLNVKERVGCNCVKCVERMKVGKKPTFYDFEKLQRYIENGRYHVDCDFEFNEQINIGQLLSEVMAVDAEEGVWLRRFMRELKSIGMKVDMSDRSIKMSNFGNPIVKTKSDSKSDSTSQATSRAKAEATAKAEANIQIESLLGDTEVLREDMERELPLSELPEKEIKLALSDIEALEKALTEASNADTIAEVPSRSKTRIGRFFKNLSKPDSTIFKALKVLRDGKDFAMDMANKYNQFAERLGLKPLDELAKEAIENI